MSIGSNRAFHHPSGIEEKVTFLSRPDSYTPLPHQVDVIETHMSWIFLTDRYAYKLKKPVRYDHLDFSTLAARQYDCEAEVRLNRRLTPNVYHGTVRLAVGTQGGMQLAGNGEAIDWLVMMRRLPANRMLDSMITQGTVRDSDVQKVGRVLTEFYRQAPPAVRCPATYRRMLRYNICLNHHELVLPLYALPGPLVVSRTNALLDILTQEPNLFVRRVEAGKIIDAHGDLRPEHICLEEQPAIIDCLEFNRDFRILDTVSELAFLALECDRLGAPRVGNLVLQTYQRLSHDRPPQRLVAFYKSYHALIRAKIAVWHLKEPDTRDPQQWINRANHYLGLASYLDKFDN
jgi:aminoglycoside phosphotransferase family enzyme